MSNTILPDNSFRSRLDEVFAPFGIEKGNIKAQNHFIAGLFGLVA